MPFDVSWSHIILLYLVVVNTIAFFLYGIDKYKAKHAKWRIQESTLIRWSIIGGSLGAWLGMKVWHHKTMHNKFKYGIPLIMVIQIGIVLAILYYMYVYSAQIAY